MTPSSPPSYTFLDTQRSPLLTSLASKLPNPSTNIPHQTSIPTAPPITDPTQSPPHTGPNSPGPTFPTNQPTSHEPNNIQTQTQNNPLPPPIFDPPNPQTNTNPVNEPPRTHPMITRSQSGIVKPIERLSLHTSSLSPIPKSPFIALKDPNWCNAMYDEYNALVKNGTWILVPRPSDVNLVRSMWLFKHKFHADGTLSRYKARLVANGSNQQHGVDFDETFSPVVKPATIRTVLSLAVSRQWPIHQLDVKNAFLNGDLSETVYMHQPPGFVDSRYPNHVCLLQRSLYGLKQAPRAWFQRFAGYATRAGFSPSRCDSSLFIYTQGSQVAYLLIYVDDIILTASSPVLLQQIIDSLHKEFDMTDLGALNYFLGISELSSSLQDLFLSQKIQQVCLYMHDPREPHFAALKRILRYVQGTLELGLQLYASATTSLVGYTDADWAGFPSTRSAKAEYRGVANVVAETAWIRNLLRELHSPLSTATLVYCDNHSIDTWAPELPVKRVLVLDYPPMGVDVGRFQQHAIGDTLVHMLKYSRADVALNFKSYALEEKQADWIVYVTPIRRQEHIEMCFTCARLEEWYPTGRNGYPKTSYVGYRTFSELKEFVSLFEELQSGCRAVAEGKDAKSLGYTHEAVLDCVLQ
ncbi:ribonuclease H-like domain-containing protein [Tanacetum coccineum]